MNNKLSLIVLAGVLSFCGCGGNKPEQPAEHTTTAPAAPQAAVVSPLLSPESATAQAPAVFKARFTTTKGDFVIEATRAWAPNGADRFYNLVKIGYFQDVAFFRALQGFMVQFGIHGQPEMNTTWRAARIPDDQSTGHSNTRGMITFATSGPNSRTVQLFVNYANNGNLDSMGFTPFGNVVSGMEVLDSLYKDYGEGQPGGPGPDQGRFQQEGNAYLKAEYPKLDYIKSAKLEP